MPCEQRATKARLKCLGWEAAPQRLRLHAALVGTLDARFTQPRKGQVHAAAKRIDSCFVCGACEEEWCGSSEWSSRNA